MTQLFFSLLAASALLAVVASLTMKPTIRGLRNLGILGCYISGAILIFSVRWLGLKVWVMTGLLSGLLYLSYEVLQISKATREGNLPIESRPCTGSAETGR